MNTFNRVLIAVLLLAAMVVCSFFLIVPAALDGLVQRLVALNEYQLGLATFQRYLYGGLLALVLVVVLALLFALEVRRRGPRSIRVEKTAGGEVKISVASIVDRLKFEIDQVPGVLQVKPQVSAHRGGVKLDLDVLAPTDVNLPDSAQQVIELARAVIVDMMGLKFSGVPKVNVRTVSRPRTQMRPIEQARRPQAPAPQPSQPASFAPAPVRDTVVSEPQPDSEIGDTCAEDSSEPGATK